MEFLGDNGSFAFLINVLIFSFLNRDYEILEIYNLANITRIRIHPRKLVHSNPM